MPELTTLGNPLKSTYEAENNTNAFTDAEKAKLSSLAGVATSGSYSDLTDAPTIPSGVYGDLTGKPVLSSVATSGAYADLTGQPDAILRAERAAANGVAPLDAAGLVPMVHLNVSGLSFKGAWDPTTNTPSLIDGTGSVGDFYKASTGGTYNFGNGSYTFNEGDWAIFAAGVWQRIGSSELVSSVNGKLGAVVLNAADVGAKPSSYVPAWSEVTAKPTLTNTVNGKSGAVALTAVDVGALPSDYIPEWSEVTGKPVLPALPQGATIGSAIPSLLVDRNTTLSFVSGAARHIAWDNIVYDPFGGFAGNGRYTIPAWAKFARVTVGLKLVQTGAAGSYLFAYVLVNNVQFDHIGSAQVNATAQSQRLVTSIFPVSSGDSISSSIWHNYNSNRSIEFGRAGSFMQIELFEAIT